VACVGRSGATSSGEGSGARWDYAAGGRPPLVDEDKCARTVRQSRTAPEARRSSAQPATPFDEDECVGRTVITMELLSKEEVVRHMWLLRQLATFFGKDEAARLCRPPPARACPRTGDHRGGGRAAQDEAIYSCTGARASTFYLSHKETMSMPVNSCKVPQLNKSGKSIGGHLRGSRRTQQASSWTVSRAPSPLTG
jgi:hypothetical protein